jgi:hypothetical protein
MAYPESSRLLIYSKKFQVTSSEYARISLDLEKCPQENTIFTTGQPLEPQPAVSGVFDSMSKRSRTDGNKAKALIVVKPEGIQTVGCEPSDPSEPEKQECFPYSGFGIMSRMADFDAAGEASFTNLAISIPSPGRSDDLTSKFRRFYLRVYANSFFCDNSLQIEDCGYRGALVYADCPFGFYINISTTAKLSLLTEPGDMLAGAQFLRQPKLEYRDSYGNMVAQLEDAVEMFVVGTNLTSTYNQRYYPQNITTAYTGKIINKVIR